MIVDGERARDGSGWHVDDGWEGDERGWVRGEDG